jgi:hypothetical protein
MLPVEMEEERKPVSSGLNIHTIKTRSIPEKVNQNEDTKLAA